MSAGHIVYGQCVDVAVSSDLYFGSLKPSVTSGIDTFVTYPVKTSGWYLTTFKNGQFFSSNTLTSPGFSSCDTTEQFVDGLAVGWGIVAAMVAAWAIHNLRKGL